MLPAILTLIVLACGGGFFVFKKVQEKKKEQEVAKPDPDADYVDDDEDYGYDPEFDGVDCGPRAYLRPGTHMLDGSKAGTHVEINSPAITLTLV